MDTDKLKALALAATPGPWEDGGYTVYQVGGEEICKHMSEEDSAYVAAACPATVLELIAEVERLRADAGRYRWLRDEARAEYEERIFVTSDGHKDYYEPSGMYETELDDAVDKAIEKEKA
jgi:hypothetical protein